MRAVLRTGLRLSALLALFAGACELGMRDKTELSGGGGKDGGAGTAGTGGKIDGGACDKSYSDCDGVSANGCETYVLKDPKNCGACKNVCPSFGSTPICDNGKCGTSKCAAPSLDCDSDPATCETNSNTSVTNCGYCGHACNIANAVQECVGGACQFTKCQPGFDDCDGIPANGCEASLTSSANCGACGKACSVNNGTGSCDTGSCAVGSCNAGYANCDNNAANGCEANLATDPANCGKCGTACQSGQVCKNSACQATTCTAPMADCDTNPADCETNVQTSVANCGYCNNPCALPNATPACTAGQCTVASCNSGFGDCDTSAPGCETTLGTVTNCSACGDKCGSGPNVASSTCNKGTCAMTCVAGFGDCSASAPGCETAVSNDAANCGSCGHSCAATAPPNSVGSCANGVCSYVCASGFGDCTTAPGCETNLTTSATNCGDCGRTCPATSCNAGLCVPEVVNGLSGARALDASPTTVYVGRSPGGIVSIDRSNWTTYTLIDPGPNVVAIDYFSGTNNLFFVDPTAGIRREPAGGGFTDNIEGKNNGYDIDAAGDGRVYFSFTSGEGLERAQQGGAGKTIIDPATPVHGLRADSTTAILVWALPTLGEIRTAALGVITPSTLASGQSSPEDVAVDATYVFWTNNGDGTIMRIPRDQSTGPVALATGQTGAFAIAVSTTDVYWTTDLASGGVYKVAKTGGSVKKLADGAANPKDMIVDGNDVIWVEFGSGKVKRVPK